MTVIPLHKRSPIIGLNTRVANILQNIDVVPELYGGSLVALALSITAYSQNKWRQLRQTSQAYLKESYPTRHASTEHAKLGSCKGKLDR